MINYKKNSAGHQITGSSGHQRRRLTSFVSLLSLLAFSSLFFALSPMPSSAAEIKPGEKIVYDIKKMFKVGQAVLEYKGPVTIENQQLIHILVTMRAPNFYDQEDIFVEPINFYPVLVKRNLNIFGKKEKIIERYDQIKGTVEIIKNVRGKDVKQTIERKTPIENLYGFIYQFRLKGDLQNTSSVTMHLPTKDVIMKNLGAVDIAAGGKTYKTVLLESDPKQYSLWFDTQGNSLPVKIDGGLGAIKAVMVLREVKN